MYVCMYVCLFVCLFVFCIHTRLIGSISGSSLWKNLFLSLQALNRIFTTVQRRYPIGSMGLAYLPTFTIDLSHSCR